MAGRIHMEYEYKIVTRYCMDTREVQMSDTDKKNGWKFESWKLSACHTGCYIAMELCRRTK